MSEKSRALRNDGIDCDRRVVRPCDNDIFVARQSDHELDSSALRFPPGHRLDANYVARWVALRRDRDRAGHYNYVQDREIRRLRAELEAQHDAPSAVARIVHRLKRRFGKGFDGPDRI